ncbi:MAG: FecR domain-containing protein [Candidatus Accumulibacter sp.]|jgi:transmembrane sensor|nr:FecR domain-containing protein [Accumulibacter sp.]
MNRSSDGPNLSQDEIEERAMDEYARRHPVDYTAAVWHLRKLEGFSGSAEKREFEDWLAASPAHAAAFREIERGHEELRRLSPAERAHLQAMCAPPTARPVPARWRGFPAWRLAAASCVCAAVFLALGWQYLTRPAFEQRYASERGQQLSVSLPDGSALLLDSLSRAEVVFYRYRREVRLPAGQILFHVAANAEKPFDVLAGNTRVRVVGTQFSVRHIPGDPLPGNVEVRVAEGRLRVSGRTADGGTIEENAVELLAGQELTLDPAGVPGVIAQLAPENVAPWRVGRLTFDGALLSDALAEFERYGPTGLIIRDPQVARLHISGSFEVRRIDAFTRTLPRILPVRLEARDGLIEIVRADG